MPSFEFLCPDKSPPNARMPKRLNTLKRKKMQPTHTPHQHHEKAPRSFHEYPQSFAKTTIAHSKFPMCIDAKFPHVLICTPKFRNAPKSKVSDYLKRPSKFPYTHEVRGFGLSNGPTHPTKHPHHTPEAFWVSDSLQNPHLSRENFTPRRSRPTTARATANGR